MKIAWIDYRYLGRNKFKKRLEDKGLEIDKFSCWEDLTITLKKDPNDYDGLLIHLPLHELVAYQRDLQEIAETVPTISLMYSGIPVLESSGISTLSYNHTDLIAEIFLKRQNPTKETT